MGWLSNLLSRGRIDMPEIYPCDEGENLPVVVVTPVEVVPKFDIVANEGMRDDAPRFRREYAARLTPRVSIKVSARSYWGYGRERTFMGELRQNDGRWVTFDPDRVADKILDPVLVPLVEEACREIRRIDRAYMSPPPNSFVDDRGQRWVRG